LLELRREMDRGATARVEALGIVRQVADNHRPGVQPETQRDPLWLAPDRVRLPQTLLQFEGGDHSAPGMVLLRHGRTKQRQETLAGDVHEGAIIALERGIRQRHHRLYQVVQSLRFQRGVPC
jgi:hypothetical protein